MHQANVPKIILHPDFEYLYALKGLSTYTVSSYWHSFWTMIQNLLIHNQLLKNVLGGGDVTKTANQGV